MKIVRDILGGENNDLRREDAIETLCQRLRVGASTCLEVDDLPTRMNARIRSARGNRLNVFLENLMEGLLEMFLN